METKTFGVGDRIADRFTIEEILPALGSYPRFRANDQGNRVVLSQVGRPSKESEPDKVKRGIERATRALSWVRVPGCIVPKEFIMHQGILFSVLPEIKGIPLDTFLKEQPPPLSRMVQWVTDIAQMLEQIHESRQPQYVANLPIRNLQINADGGIQLYGFDLNPQLKLEFIPVDDTAPRVPDARIDARSDVWCLGRLLQQMVEHAGDAARKAYREEGDLRSLIQTMTHEDPEKRLSGMATLRSRLERMRWKDGPKVDKASQLDSPITELTVEEVDRFRDVKQRIRIYIGLGLLIFLVVALIGQTLFPEAEF